MKETIVAIATSTAGKAGVNIVRLSGNKAKLIRKKIFFKKGKPENMVANVMYLGTIKGHNFFEQALCVYFKAPKSYTGEDVIEFHCHGGVGVANAVMRLCIDNGACPATAGEFTKRAFFNGKIDLSQAEGIAEIINAESESEIMQSYRLLSGEISQGIHLMGKQLLKIIAGLEVRLDYPEETEDEEDSQYVEKIDQIIKEIEELLEGAKYTKTITEGINVAIVGLPNVGKSSLLNGLVMADRAIVTQHAGTTRDIIKEKIVLDGIKVNILDTAGIRLSDNEIENMGIERSKKAIKEADIIIFVMDLSQPITQQELELEKELKNKTIIRVANKKDKNQYPRKNVIEIKAKPPREIEEIKCKLLEKIGRDKIFNTSIITAERHIESLKQAKNYLEKAKKEIKRAPTECILVDIREAYSQLAAITGEQVNESIIEEVFSTFCVGK